MYNNRTLTQRPFSTEWARQGASKSILINIDNQSNRIWFQIQYNLCNINTLKLFTDDF